MKKKNLCVIGSLYGLLVYEIYMFSKGCKAIEDTYFIFSSEIPKEIRRKFKHHTVMPKVPRFRVFKVMLYIIYLILLPIIRIFFNSKMISGFTVYGHDHLYFSRLLGEKYIAIEDGLGNYLTKGPNLSRFMELVLGLRNGECVGYSFKAKKVILTGIGVIPEALKKKVEVIDLQKKWGAFEGVIRTEINDSFSFFPDFKDAFKDCDLILTQPVSEDGLCSESFKSKKYLDMVSDHSIDKMVLKKHPRDMTNYKNIFDNITYELPSSVPNELLTLNGMKFNRAFTLWSTSIFTVSAPEKIIVGSNGFDLKNCKAIQFQIIRNR